MVVRLRWLGWQDVWREEHMSKTCNTEEKSPEAQFVDLAPTLHI